jgi:tRNA threonylcarbamoyl adenosine modification protein YeaZ
MSSNLSGYGLAIHTASPDLGFAIDNFVGDRRQRVWTLGRDASNYLHEYLGNFLPPQTWSDLRFIAVAKGPGGFTGTRLGVVTARTLAQQLEIPLFAVSTLAAIAWQSRSPNATIAVQMRAQRSELFGAIYTATAAGLATVLPDTVFSSAAWQKLLEEHHPRIDRIVEATDNLGDSVSSVLELAYLNWQSGDRPHWSETLPFYGQHPVQT